MIIVTATVATIQINIHEAITAMKPKVWNAYCSIYNIFILDRFLYIFVPYTLLRFFYNIQDANLYQKRCLLRHKRRSEVDIVAACVRTQHQTGSWHELWSWGRDVKTFGFELLEPFICTYRYTQHYQQKGGKKKVERHWQVWILRILVILLKLSVWFFAINDKKTTFD